MASSLGDQLGALLGTQVTDAGGAGDVSPNAANAGSKKGPANIDLPAGVHDDIAAIIKKMANDEVESLELPTPLTDYDFDHLSIVELAIRCEKKLGVHIEDEGISSFKTLGDVVNYIVARRG